MASDPPPDLLTLMTKASVNEDIASTIIAANDKEQLKRNPITKKISFAKIPSAPNQEQSGETPTYLAKTSYLNQKDSTPETIGRRTAHVTVAKKKVIQGRPQTPRALSKLLEATQSSGKRPKESVPRDAIANENSSERPRSGILIKDALFRGDHSDVRGIEISEHSAWETLSRPLTAYTNFPTSCSTAEVIVNENPEIKTGPFRNVGQPNSRVTQMNVVLVGKLLQTRNTETSLRSPTRCSNTDQPRARQQSAGSRKEEGVGKGEPVELQPYILSDSESENEIDDVNEVTDSAAESLTEFSTIEEVDSVLTKYAAVLADRQRRLKQDEIKASSGGLRVSSSKRSKNARPWTSTSGEVSFSNTMDDTDTYSGAINRNDSRSVDVDGTDDRLADSTAFISRLTNSPHTVVPTTIQVAEGISSWKSPDDLLEHLKAKSRPSSPEHATFDPSSKWGERGGVYQFSNNEDTSTVYESPISRSASPLPPVANIRSAISTGVLVDLDANKKSLQIEGSPLDKKNFSSNTSSPTRNNRTSSRKNEVSYLERQRARLRQFEEKRRAIDRLKIQHMEFEQPLKPAQHMYHADVVKHVAADDFDTWNSAVSEPDRNTPSPETANGPPDAVFGSKVHRPRRFISTESLLLATSEEHFPSERVATKGNGSVELTTEKFQEVLPLLKMHSVGNADSHLANQTTKLIARPRRKYSIPIQPLPSPIAENAGTAAAGRTDDYDFAKPLPPRLRSRISEILGVPETPSEEAFMEISAPTLIVDGKSLAMTPSENSRPPTGKTRWTPAPPRLAFTSPLHSTQTDTSPPETSIPSVPKDSIAEEDKPEMGHDAQLEDGTHKDESDEHALSVAEFRTGGGNDDGIESFDKSSSSENFQIHNVIQPTAIKIVAPFRRESKNQGSDYIQSAGPNFDYALEPATWISPIPAFPICNEVHQEDADMLGGAISPRGLFGNRPGYLPMVVAEPQANPSNVLDDVEDVTFLQGKQLLSSQRNEDERLGAEDTYTEAVSTDRHYVDHDTEENEQLFSTEIQFTFDTTQEENRSATEQSQLTANEELPGSPRDSSDEKEYKESEQTGLGDLEHVPGMISLPADDQAVDVSRRMERSEVVNGRMLKNIEDEAGTGEHERTYMNMEEKGNESVKGDDGEEWKDGEEEENKAVEENLDGIQKTENLEKVFSVDDGFVPLSLSESANVATQEENDLITTEGPRDESMSDEKMEFADAVPSPSDSHDDISAEIKGSTSMSTVDDEDEEEEPIDSSSSESGSMTPEKHAKFALPEDESQSSSEYVPVSSSFTEEILSRVSTARSQTSQPVYALPRSAPRAKTALEEIADRPASDPVPAKTSAEPSVKPSGIALYDLVFNPVRRMKVMTKEELKRHPAISDWEVQERPQTGDDQAQIRQIEDQVEWITRIIESDVDFNPAPYLERCMLYARKRLYEEALSDANLVIDNSEKPPTDALWLRYQIYLITGKTEWALRDLDTITDNDRTYFGAYQSKARIYQELGMVKLAIVNYSQVIRLRPKDPDGYYARGCLFEAENEVVYADEDFNMVRRLDPSNTHALLKQAMHCFDRQLWEDSIKSFTFLINTVPEFATAYMFRGRALAQLQIWDAALEDLTKAIQLAPERADYYFYRGCLFCERNKKKALEDFGISLLLDDSPRNCDVYFYRGLVYNRSKRKDLAIRDFEIAIKSVPENPTGHLNLGILHMQHSHDYRLALECFNNAIRYDSNSTRAYLCRGDLYQMMHSAGISLHGDDYQGAKGRTEPSYIDRAIKDYSKTIHLQPKNYLFYLYRGRLLLRLGQMRLALFDFHAAFELNSAIAQTFVQRALVLSFQRKYQQAIDEFAELSKRQLITDASLYILIAKAKMKCSDSQGALIELMHALSINPNDPQIYLQRGLCYENLKDYSAAQAEFSKCLDLNSRFAKAYYHRGVCKLQMKNARGINDINKALKFDSKLFDAYLTRAGCYEAKGLYTRGLEDCNMALKIEPSSIRGFLLRGTIKCKLRQYGLALADFTSAITLDRNCHLAYYNRAVTYQMIGKLNAAIRDYSIILIFTENHNAYRNRGLIYWQKEDHGNALLDFAAAKNNFPEDARLYCLLGRCLQKVGRTKDSLQTFTDAIAVDPYMKESYLGRGNVYAGDGDTVNARRDYGRVLHLYPSCLQAYVNTAYVFQQEGRYKKAFDLFSLALIIDPRSTHAMEGRAAVLLAMGNYFAALIDIERALVVSPNDAELLTNRGVVHQYMNDVVTALIDFKRATKINPKNFLAYYNAANLYTQQCQWTHALLYYNKALEICPKDESAMLNRGIVHAMLRNFSEALNDFNGALKNNPSSAHVYFNRAHLYMKMEMFAEAEADYNRVCELAPDDIQGLFNRGNAIGQQSRIDEAMIDHAKALTLKN